MLPDHPYFVPHVARPSEDRNQRVLSTRDVASVLLETDEGPTLNVIGTLH